MQVASLIHLKILLNICTYKEKEEEKKEIKSPINQKEITVENLISEPVSSFQVVDKYFKEAYSSFYNIFHHCRT